MKSKTKTHSIRDDIVKPQPYIDINKAIFEKVEGLREYTKDSLMYQDILKYGTVEIIFVCSSFLKLDYSFSR